jgi:outer membrane immunogenic protein
VLRPAFSETLQNCSNILEYVDPAPSAFGMAKSAVNHLTKFTRSVERRVKNSMISAMAMALSLGLMTPADAEDWTGPYLTFGLSSASTNLRDAPETGDSLAETDEDIAPYVAAGYDWAYGNLTLGVLADVDLTGVDNDDLVSSGKGFYGESDWFATFRGRVGMPVSEQVHVFASGGLALMRAGATGVDLFGARSSDSELLKGAVVGLGMEYSLSPGRLLSVEYLYADFEQSGEFFSGGPVAGTVDPIVSAIRIGYTFRF